MERDPGVRRYIPEAPMDDPVDQSMCWSAVQYYASHRPRQCAKDAVYGSGLCEVHHARSELVRKSIALAAARAERTGGVE